MIEILFIVVRIIKMESTETIIITDKVRRALEDKMDKWIKPFLQQTKNED